jgi:hypothetical protein
MGQSAGGTDAVMDVTPTHEVAWHSIADNDAILKQLQTSLDGLSSDEAARRLQM